jgi:hypothetical protein
MPIEQKYIVIPVDKVQAGQHALWEQDDDDFEDAVKQVALSPDEFFVVKASDIFASAALHGYAHVIQSALELDSSRPFLTVEEVVRLRDLADTLSQRAMDWQAGSRKVPD